MSGSVVSLRMICRCVMRVRGDSDGRHAAALLAMGKADVRSITKHHEMLEEARNAPGTCLRHVSLFPALMRAQPRVDRKQASEVDRVGGQVAQALTGAIVRKSNPDEVVRSLEPRLLPPA